MQSIKRVALSSPETSYPDGKSRYVVSQMFTQFGGHSGEVKLYEYESEVRPGPVPRSDKLSGGVSGSTFTGTDTKVRVLGQLSQLARGWLPMLPTFPVSG